jgi:hypothetical protein
MLRLYPGHALGHFELGRVCEKLGDDAAASEEYATFLEMWSGADEGLPQLEEARARLAALRAG